MHRKFFAAASAVGVFAIAAPAGAHVTVAAPGVTVGGSDASINFRVPDESATASTVGLKVQLPIDTPLLGVLVAPTPGWAAKVIQTKLATPVNTDDGPVSRVVSEIDWTAAPGAGIKPGFFGQFSIIAGQLPDKIPTLTFKAIQTYSDGTVVSWIEVPAPGSATAPEHPAPKLALASDQAAAPATATAAKSGNPTATVLAVIALVLAAAALGVSLVNRAKGSKDS